MPYHKKRKTTRLPRGQVPEPKIKDAVSAVLGGRIVYSVAKETGISAVTLKRYVRKMELNPDTVCRLNFVTKTGFYK